MIDSHAHVETDDYGRYPPRADVDPASLQRAIASSFTAEQLLASMDASGVDRALVLQKNSIHGTDNRYVLDVAKATPERLSAVVVVDAKRVSDAELAGVTAEDPRGIRISPMTSGLAEDRAPGYTGWLDSSEALRVWSAAADQGLPVCVHLIRANRSDGLAALAALLTRFTSVEVLLDHVAVCDIESGPPDFGLEPLAVVDRPNVTVKVSPQNFSVVEEAGFASSEFLRRLCDVVGAERVSFGSDVTNTPGTYGELIGRGLAAAEPLTTEERTAVFGANTGRLYRLGGG